MVQNETKSCKDEKQVDVQKMTIYDHQSHSKETGSLNDKQGSG